MGFWGVAIAGFAAQQAVAALGEVSERHRIYVDARSYSEAVGKPMLVVGRPIHSWEAPCSPDYTLDLSPDVLGVCPIGGIQADVRDIPLPTRSVGATAIFHVLEHLHSIEDLQVAWSELWRVSETVMVAYPRFWFARNVLHEDHWCWTRPEGEVLWVRERRGRHRQAWIGPDGSVVG